MATVGTYPTTGETYLGTCSGMQQDEKSTASATWIAWAEESTAATFYYWSSDQEVSGIGPTLDVYPGRTVVQKPEPESEEDRLAREKSEEEARLAHEEEKRKEKEAEHKAKVLLLELIGHVDYKKFCRAGYIDVEGNSGKIYRISPRAMTKVFAGKDKLDVKLESLCIETRDRALPEADEMVWKKLMVESDEKAFVETANHFDNHIDS
ncbi:hypothetical protein ES703_50925 [subsurface metagenome]